MVMNKKMTMALVATILLSAFLATTVSLPATANAALGSTTLQTPTIAILDTAIDTSIPQIKNSIVHEVCITEYYGCNGQAFAEGPGSATLPANFISSNGFEHGTQMASIALQANPNVKIVFVRIIGNSRLGFRHPAGENTVNNALEWVIANKDKFNIHAVSMSQAIRNQNSKFPLYMSPAGTEYCPKTPVTEQKITSLVNAGVPVFLPAGNDSDITRINWPACITNSVSIGATMATKQIAFYTNYDLQKLDFFALGTWRGLNPGNKTVNIIGTSASTVAAATAWATLRANNTGLSYSDMYSLYSSKSVPTFNSKITNGRLINNG